MARPWLVLFLLGAVARLAHAQIVNVQGTLATAPTADDTIGQLEAKLNWRDGNNPLFDIGGAGTVLARRGPVLLLALARGEYATRTGLTLTRKSFEHTRARLDLDDRWRWELFAQHEYDQFRRLSLRALIGSGPAYRAIDDPALSVLVGAAYLYEYEQLDTRPGTLDAGLRTTDHRASFYVTGHEALPSGVAVVETLYAQPRLDHPADLRVLAELSFVSKLSPRVALKNSLTLAYDATPPDGVKPRDSQLDLALLITL
jgi:hypothetical protein